MQAVKDYRFHLIAILITNTAVAYTPYSEIPDWYKTPTQTHQCGNLDMGAPPVHKSGDGKVDKSDLDNLASWIRECPGTKCMTDPVIARMDWDADGGLDNDDLDVATLRGFTCYPTDINPSDVNRDGVIDIEDRAAVEHMVQLCAGGGSLENECTHYLQGRDPNTGLLLRDPINTPSGGWALRYCDVDRNEKCDSQDVALVQMAITADVDYVEETVPRTFVGYKKMLVVVLQMLNGQTNPTQKYGDKLAQRVKSEFERISRKRVVIDPTVATVNADFSMTAINNSLADYRAQGGTDATHHFMMNSLNIHIGDFLLDQHGIDHQKFDNILVVMPAPDLPYGGLSDYRRWAYVFNYEQGVGWSEGGYRSEITNARFAVHELMHTTNLDHSNSIMPDVILDGIDKLGSEAAEIIDEGMCLSVLAAFPYDTPTFDSTSDPASYEIGDTIPSHAAPLGWYGPGEIIKAVPNQHGIYGPVSLAPAGGQATPDEYYGIQVQGGEHGKWNFWIHQQDDSRMVGTSGLPQTYVTLAAAGFQHESLTIDRTWKSNNRYVFEDILDGWYPDGYIHTIDAQQHLLMFPYTHGASRALFLGMGYNFSDPQSPLPTYYGKDFRPARALHLSLEKSAGLIDDPNYAFRYVVFDPEVGTANGDGIDSVKISWLPVPFNDSPIRQVTFTKNVNEVDNTQGIYIWDPASPELSFDGGDALQYVLSSGATTAPDPTSETFPAPVAGDKDFGAQSRGWLHRVEISTTNGRSADYIAKLIVPYN